MRYIFLLLAVLCGIALVIKIDTGSEPMQVAGAGILLLATLTLELRGSSFR